MAGDGRRWNLAVAALALGTLLNPLNSAMLAVALVTLREEFGVSVGEIAWVVTVFYLTSAVAQPLMGRIADLAGPRRVFVCGMLLVAVASAIAPVTGSFVMLCAMRAVISVGTSAAYPAALAIIRRNADDAGGSALQAIARVQFGNSVGVVLGPVLGGLVVSLLPWQTLFWLSSPLALLSMVLVLRLLEADGFAARGFRSFLTALDVPGVLWFSALIVPALVALGGLSASITAVLVTISAVALVGLVRRSRRVAHPFIDLDLVSGARTAPIYLGFWLMTMVYYCVFYGLPQYLEEAVHLDAAHVGLLMMPLAGMTLVANPVVARALARFGSQRVLLVGIAWMIPAAALMLVLRVDTASWVVLGICALLGVPYCIVALGFGAATYDAAPAAKVGIATGVLQTCRHLGGAVALAVLGLVFAEGVEFTAMVRLVAIMLFGCLAAATVVTSWRPGNPGPVATEP